MRRLVRMERASLTSPDTISCRRRPCARTNFSEGSSMNLDELRRDYDVVPVFRELSADTLTPLSAFVALSPSGTEAFLFESVERGENLGRYSFVGFDPRRSLRFDRNAADPIGTLNAELVP